RDIRRHLMIYRDTNNSRTIITLLDKPSRVEGNPYTFGGYKFKVSFDGEPEKYFTVLERRKKIIRKG
ncbi:MAG: hypothetical protein DRG33_05310, partial [Deltaproteobacteria bacterium]